MGDPVTEPTPISGAGRSIAAHDVLELLVSAIAGSNMALAEAPCLVRGPRDKGPAGALRLQFSTGQIFYLDVTEEEQ